MPSSKKPRCKHKPKATKVGGGLHAIMNVIAREERKKPIPQDEQRDLSICYRIAFEIMLNGKSREEDWCTCVVSLNVGMVLAERYGTDENVAVFVEALDGAFRAKIRAQRTGSWRFDGEAINAIKSAYYIHELQLEQVNKGELVAALNEVTARVEKGNVYER